jgi:DNA-binding IscR family transcriptional regulator
LPRKRDLAAAIAAHNRSTFRDAPLLSSHAIRLLTVMFADADTCQRTLDSLAREGFNPSTLHRFLKNLSDAGFISIQRGVPNTYRLHLPPRVQP